MDEKKILKKLWKKDNFAVLFLTGLLLFVILLPMEKKDRNKKSESQITDNGSAIMNVTKDTPAMGDAEEVSCASYREEMEEALEKLLGTMEGAGRVKVMITLESSQENIVEKDSHTKLVTSTEVDSSGGSRNTADSDQEEVTIRRQEEPFVRTVIYPKIRGVLVCVQGGDSAAVNKNITEAIQALFGIEAHKIKVIKMSSR